MGLEDRDWYREEIARRRSGNRKPTRPLQRSGLGPAQARPAVSVSTVSIDDQPPAARGRWQTALNVAIAVMAVAQTCLAVLLVTFTPACDRSGWTTRPIACWRWSWDALVDRVAAATRGYPVMIVQSGRDDPAGQPQKLPSVVRPGQR
jgi:hypothetical protein